MDMQKAKYIAYKIAGGCLQADHKNDIVTDLLPNMPESDQKRVSKALQEIIDMCYSRSGPKSDK
jgi:hypothetical protein